MTAVLLVGLEPNVEATLRSGPLRDARLTTAGGEHEAVSAMRAGRFDLVVVGTAAAEPVELAQRAHALAPSTAVVLFTERSRVDALRAAVQLVPFVGSVTCLPDDEPGALRDVLALAERRRKLRTVLGDANARIARSEAPARASAYLGALLTHAPVGVVLLDRGDRVRGMNPLAATFFERSEREAIGRPWAELFGDRERDGAASAPERAPPDGSQTVVRTRRNGAEQILELTLRSLDPAVDDAGRLVIVQDVTERARLLAELSEAVRVRDEFLAIASHELKTPLAAMKLLVQGHRRRMDRGQPADPRELVTRTEAAIARLGRLVDDLLDPASLASERLPLRIEPVDLVALAREAIDAMASIAAGAGCTITLVAPDTAVGAWDRTRLEQVLTNLLANALKFGRGAPVDVRVEGERDDVILSVRDRGIGIAPEDHARVFERFARAVSSDRYGGFGLGLWITRRIVEALGGRVTLESAPGRGATFRVRLPRGGGSTASPT